ncbi:hypothetical protein [Bacillus pseudomycoides]|uniref:hypothetical protein n=1 Tax=Bacillus pseudomycoides TaxID=64104 RepID=UPI000BFA1E44|nr:hypothetical protein [Bacillus pseudomycoides]PFY85636.1 hypothetical protein COL53_26370 [Bacillus pseudomycoides]
MIYQNEKIRRKKALISAKKVFSQFSNLELIEFENPDSAWIELFDAALKKFRNVDSKPTFHIPIGDVKSKYILWIESSLGSLGSLSFSNHKTEYFILVPNCLEPIWANVRILNFTKSIEELWDISETNEFIIADKSTGQIAQIFSEEECYEIHFECCNTNPIDSSKN